MVLVYVKGGGLGCMFRLMMLGARVLVGLGDVGMVKQWNLAVCWAVVVLLFNWRGYWWCFSEF